MWWGMFMPENWMVERTQKRGERKLKSNSKACMEGRNYPEQLWTRYQPSRL